ncbi:MAG: hypothetical protein UY78_C0036G0002 [Parcubacteria group bacterium GW2011_GWA1_53_13]|nr:MAG: hypothetical protein UY78_C0036G0002 [Parcubacteria group bacterium GW2011_GWA1_53_13]
MANPMPTFSSAEECRVILKGWVLVGSTKKPLEEVLQWVDVYFRIDLKATYQYLPLNRVLNQLTKAEKHSAKQRIFGMISSARRAALKKAKANALKGRQLDLFRSGG